MADYGHKYTDDELAALTKTIASVYKEAAGAVNGIVTDYFNSFIDRDANQRELLKAGEITNEEYRQWRSTQIARGDRWELLRERLANRYVEADQVAIAYINDRTPGIYTLNRNYTSYRLEQAGINHQFTLWDEQTVRRLIMTTPDLMPHYPEAKAIARGIDLEYGKQQITACVTKNILMGSSLGRTAKDLQSRMQNMSRDSAIRTARTAVTEAENAGRQDQMEQAADMGIHVTKVWRCVKDFKTRPDHAEADGQEVDYNEPFDVGGYEMMFPGDDSLGAPGKEIYNCRCRMITGNDRELEAEPRQIRVRDPLTGKNVVVSDMTYKEWEKWAKERMANGTQS